VVDAGEFYVQRVGEPRVAWIAEQLRIAAAADAPPIPVSDNGLNGVLVACLVPLASMLLFRVVRHISNNMCDVCTCPAA
jgi:hypothetical protein